MTTVTELQTGKVLQVVEGKDKEDIRLFQNARMMWESYKAPSPPPTGHGTWTK